MESNICPRCGAKMNIDDVGNASCDYCGYKKVSDLSILDARGREELAKKKAEARATTHATTVAEYNSAVNAVCIDYNTAKKPLLEGKKQRKSFIILMFLPVLFLIVLLITYYEEIDFVMYVAIALLALSLLADIGFLIAIISTTSSMRQARKRMDTKREKIIQLLTAHPDGDRSAEADEWIAQFDTSKTKK